MSIRALLCLSLAVSIPASATDTVLFEQLPQFEEAVPSDAGGFASDQRYADRFSFDEASTINSVDFWGVYIPVDTVDPTSLDDFSVIIYADSTTNPGRPGAIVYSETNASTVASQTGVVVLDIADQYLYSLTLDTPLTLDAGTPYYISVFNNTGLAADSGTWGWQLHLLDGNGGWLSNDSGGFWAPSNTANMSFRLVGSSDASDCPADLSSPNAAGQPDGVLTGADFFEFLDRFQAGDLSIDFSSPTQPGTPDGALTGADFFAFLDLFTQGC